MTIALTMKVFHLAAGTSTRAGQARHKARTGKTPPRRNRIRPPRCDCGQPAVTVLTVRVGTNPQYTVRLWLCSACLALEQGFQH